MSGPGPSRRSLLASLLKDAWRADPRLVVAVTAMRIGAAVLTPLDAVALGLLLDAGISRNVGAALGWAALFAVADVGSSALNHPAGKWEQTLREKTAFIVEQRLLALTLAPATLEHLERPEYHDQVKLARDRSMSLGNLMVRTLALLQALVLTAVVVAVLATVHWTLVGLVLAALPTLYLCGRAEVVRTRGKERAVAAYRLADRLLDLATRPGSVAEIKVSGAEALILDRFDQETQRALPAVAATERRAAALVAAGWLFFGLAFFAAIAFVANQALTGHGSVGQVVLVLVLAIRLNEQVSDLSAAVSGARRAVIDVTRLVWLYRSIDSPPAGGVMAGTAPGEDRPAAAGGAGDIELRDVWFRYPGTDADILRGVSLRLPADGTVAIVGDNGAGKTTLIKLLCGLYAPTRGTITVGGTDLRDLDATQWRRRISASFQDFLRPELLAGEAVGVGRVEYLDEPDEIWDAIRRAGADPFVRAMPRGLDTQLGPQWPDGTELSLGQWQKVALGRALMRRSPALLVLDEPTASLDTETEHALYARFNRAGDAAARQGTVQLLVSHRFSTVRTAEVIVLLRDGVVRELGSHEELMRLGGVYAELFTLQANGYR